MYRDKDHVNKLGTLVLVLGAVILCLGTIGNFKVYTRMFFRSAGLASPISTLTAITVIAFVVFFMIWHYHNWDLLDKDLRKTTPGKAVGYLFIPFYNFYWIFVSYIWLWEGLNAMGKRYMSKDWVEMSLGIPIAFAILVLLSAIPFVGITSGVLTLLLIMKTNSYVRELWEAAEAGRSDLGHTTP